MWLISEKAGQVAARLAVEPQRGSTHLVLIENGFRQSV